MLGTQSWGFDMEDTENEFVFRAELPGFEPNDLDVQVSGQLLTVKAEKKEQRTEKQGNGHYRERQTRSFQRTITLPAGVDPEKIEARCHQGILEVHVPKTEKARGKRIPVQA